MKLKKYILWGTLLFLALSLIGIGLPSFEAWYWPRASERLGDHYTPIMEYMAVNGPAPDLQQRLLDHSRPSRVKAVFIIRFGPGEPRVIAADPDKLVGSSLDALTEVLDLRTDYTPYTRVFQGAGNAPYQLVLILQRSTWLTPFGIALFFGGMALAWLSIALWVYLDARDRAPGAALAWLLLALLAGPVALAVWLISRGTRPDAPAKGICPGCGQETPADAIFCPQCRFTLRPSCPSCHQAVRTTWTYCTACGSDLAEPVELDPTKRE